MQIDKQVNMVGHAVACEYLTVRMMFSDYLCYPEKEGRANFRDKIRSALLDCDDDVKVVADYGV